MKSVDYDPVIKRYRVECGCGRVFVRAKREAAEHACQVHINYDHEAKEPKS